MKRFWQKLILLTIAVAMTGVLSVTAQQDDLPEEAEPFVEAGMKAAAFEKADLNGDGREDYIIILDEDVCREDDYYKTLKRTTVIILRDRNGKLRRTARNENVVFCRNCPSGFEDGFEDIVIEKKGFTIWNTVGKSDRTVFKYTFLYETRAKTWKLERFEKTEYNTSNNSVRNQIFTAPRHFTPITFADFNPTKFKVKK